MADSTIIVLSNISCPFPFPSFFSIRPPRLQIKRSCWGFCYPLKMPYSWKCSSLIVSLINSWQSWTKYTRMSVPLDLINLVKQDILWYCRFQEDQYWPCDKVIRILNKRIVFAASYSAPAQDFSHIYLTYIG